MVAPELLAQVVHLAFQAAVFERALHHQLDGRGVERLGDEVIGAGTHRAYGLGHVAVGGDHDDQRRSALALQAVEHREAVHARHFEVQQQQVGTIGQPQRFHAVEHMIDLMPELLQPVPQHAADAGIVVRDEDAAHQAGPIAGMFKVKVLPWPGAEFSVISPPCSRARFLAMASPRPLPGATPAARPRKKRSNKCGTSSAGTPGPWSSTRMRNAAAAGCARTRTLDCGGLNFTALSTRLIRICLSLSASASTRVEGSPCASSSVTAFFCAAGRSSMNTSSSSG